MGALRRAGRLEGAGEGSETERSPEEELLLGAANDGRYDLIGELARGGVGVVLQARDRDLDREVALKVLRERYASRPELVSRLVEEAQIGGQLQHPGVVPVYELGLRGDGDPYLAMQLVRGRTFAALLAERDTPATDLPRMEAIFRKIAQTIAYAHARGVIHRDLKPANVMVGSRGEVQVLDWGFAKVLARGGIADELRSRAEHRASEVRTARSSGEDEDGRSCVGSVMGTPAYMPPEQARGDIDRIDERSDVFALGAMLCEILTGAPPYVAAPGEDALLLASRAELGPAQQRLARCAVDPDLVALCLHLLEPLPASRPRDAGVVVQALEKRALQIEERARVAEERAVRSAVHAAAEKRRRKLVIALAGVLLLAFGGAALALLEVREERTRALEAREARVAEALEQARLAHVAALVRDVGSGAWDLAVLRAREAQRLAPPGEVAEATRARVETLVAQIEHEAGEARARWEKRTAEAAFLAELQSMRESAVDHWLRKEQDQRFRNAFRRFGLDFDALSAAELAQRIRETGMGDAIGEELDAWIGWQHSSLYSSTVERDAKLLEVAQLIDTDRRFLPIRILLRSRDVRALEELAKTADVLELSPSRIAILAESLGHGEPAREAAALELLWRAYPRHPGEFWIVFLIGHFSMHVTPPDPRIAAAFLEAAIALRPRSPMVWNQAAQVQLELGRLDLAREYLDRAQELAPDWAVLECNRARLLQESGDLESAEAAVRAASRREPELALARLSLGAILMARDRPREAIAELSQALRRDRSDVEVWLALGEAQRRAGELGSAADSLERALALGSAHARLRLAVVRLQQGQAKECADLCRRALEIDPEDARARYQLGLALHALRDYESALEAFDRALTQLSGDAGLHRDRGVALSSLQRFAEARKAFERSLEMFRDDPLTWIGLGQVALEEGGFEEAQRCFRRALELPGHDERAQLGLARCEEQAGRVEEAIAIARETAACFPQIAEVHSQLGYYLLHSSSTAQRAAARASFARAFSLDPAHWRAANDLGVELLAEGRPIEAIEALDRALALAPREGVLHANRARAAQDLADAATAVEHWRAVLDRDPRHLDARIDLAFALQALGRYDEAREELQRAAAIDAADPSVGWPIDEWLLELERRSLLVAALDAFRSGVRAPRDLTELERLALVHGERGEHAEARRRWRELFAQAPERAGECLSVGQLAPARALAARAALAEGAIEEALALWREELAAARAAIGGERDRRAAARRALARCAAEPALRSSRSLAGSALAVELATFSAELEAVRAALESP